MELFSIVSDYYDDQALLLITKVEDLFLIEWLIVENADCGAFMIMGLGGSYIGSL